MQPKLSKQFEDDVRIRFFKESDTNFVFNSWLKSFFDARTFSEGIPNPVFMAGHHDLVEKAIDNCLIRVAHAADDVDHLFGYVCYDIEGPAMVFHYVYVKHPYRGLGLAKELLSVAASDFNGSQFYYSHKTSFANTANKLIGGQAKYNPYIFFKGAI